MRATAYLYVIIERYPKNNIPAFHPEMICRTEAEAQFIVAELGRLAAGCEPISYEYARVPLIEVPERFRSETEKFAEILVEEGPRLRNNEY